MAIPRICSVDGCGKHPFCRGLCSGHYERWRRHGDPLSGATSKGRLREYLETEVLNHAGDECLIWPYSRSDNGYAQVTIDGRTLIASRYVCFRAHGDPPSERHRAAHSCGNGRSGCVNPKHIFWKDQAQAQEYLESVVLKYSGDECLTWPMHRSQDGYAMGVINGKHRSVCRYICTVIHGDPPTPRHEAAHSCGKGNLGCVALSHLSWKTQTENQADRIIHGTDMRGEKSWTAKLTEQQVKEIRVLLETHSERKIAKMFNVSRSCINGISAGRSWVHTPRG